MDISPLFAVDAEELLENGQVQEAIDLCLRGLEAYPGYPAGEAILARAYKLSGDEDKANTILEVAIEKNPLNRALETLKKFNLEIENVEKVEKVARFSQSSEEFNFSRNLDSIEENVEFDFANDELDISDFNDFQEDDTQNSSDVKEDVFDLYDDDFSSFEDDNEIGQVTEANDDFGLDEDLLENEEHIDEVEIPENPFEYTEIQVFSSVEKKIEASDNFEIAYDNIDLIPGLRNNNYHLQGINFQQEELINVSFNYDFKYFPANHQIKLPSYLKDYEINNLIDKLANAKIGNIRDNIPEPQLLDFEVEDIATETMGEIYYEQGAYNEAIKVFEKLKELKPEKKNLYSIKIDEIIETKEKELNNSKKLNF